VAASQETSPSAGVDPSTNPSPDASIEPGADYLADRDRFQPTDSSGYEYGPASVNGQFHTQNVRLWVSHPGAQSFATFVLGRRYARLRAVAGIDDTSHANLTVRFEIVMDNKTVFRKDMAKGAAVTIDLPVAGVYSVTLSVTQLNGDSGYGDFAEARVVP
jgi:hypothetical protein